MKSWLLFPFLILIIVGLTSSERILFLTPLGTKSHKNVFEPLIRALGERGHKMTVVANTKSSDMGENVTEIVPWDVSNFVGGFPNPLEQRRKGMFSSFWDFSFVLSACEKVYQNQEFQEVMSRTYDLVIMNGFMNACFAGYLYRMQVPFIYHISMAAPNTITTRLGNYLPPSFVPNSFLPLSERMSFLQRTVNTLMDWLFLGMRDLRYSRLYENIYRKYLGEDIPRLAEIERNMSLLFMNSFQNFPSPRPTMPDVIEVGGMHCRPAKPLPKDLDEFLTGAESGFIFFSLGSVVKSKTLPEHIRKIFLDVFSRLKQRVIWKWDEDMDDLPGNVKIGKWLPQQDILGHKNIRLFMTHGGLLSTQESIYHGVPLLGIPMFIDQDLNMNQAEFAGFAQRLEILEITEEKLEALTTQLLENPSFSERAKYLSRAFKDQMNTPTERATFWVEYVLRHKGAAHLRSAARDLNFFQYHSYDVLAFVSTILFSFLFLTIYLLRRIYFLIKYLTTGRTSGKTKEKVN